LLQIVQEQFIKTLFMCLFDVQWQRTRHRGPA